MSVIEGATVKAEHAVTRSLAHTLTGQGLLLRHFNEVDEPSLQKNDGLERLLAVEDDVAQLIGEKLPARTVLAPAEREVLASFFALLGVRLSSRFGDLDAAEARRGYDQLLPVLDGVGVLGSRAPDYFISSSAPF